MSESYIWLPTDGAGKKVRATQKTISANTVYSEQYIEDSKLNFIGGYLFSLRVVGSAVAARQFLHLYNPAASGVIVKVKGIIIVVDTGSVANQIKITRTTNLGTGTAQTPTKKFSSYPASAVNVRSAMTVNAALDNDVLGVAKPTTATYGLLNIQYKQYEIEDDQITLREGQGVVVQQLLAGAATEYLNITLEWDELTVT